MHEWVHDIVVFSYSCCPNKKIEDTMKCVIWICDRRNISVMMIMTSIFCLQDGSEKSFLEAARLGAVKQITGLLKQGVRISFKDDLGYSALHWASLYGHIDVYILTCICTVKFLIT